MWVEKQNLSFLFLFRYFADSKRKQCVREGREKWVMCVVALGSESEQERERDKGTKGYSKTQHDKAYSFVVLMIVFDF
ncbi:hypothetical protein AtNW77_Chr5g0146481 [Arabidopsis thaliana]